MATLKDLSDDIANLVEKASKSVVRVDARRGRAGTGIVWDSGLVLTANHVVEGADTVKVALADGEREFDAKVIGTDPPSDVAVLRITMSLASVSSKKRSRSASLV